MPLGSLSFSLRRVRIFSERLICGSEKTNVEKCDNYDTQQVEYVFII